MFERGQGVDIPFYGFENFVKITEFPFQCNKQSNSIQ